MASSGRAFGARYLIDDRVGAGATGVVYRGRIRDDDTPVAVKVLRPELAEDPAVVARFIRERSLVVGVRHPNLVQTLDLVIDGGQAAIVMEWVGGGDLRDDLRTHGPMEEVDAARVLRQVLSALGAVHAGGVVHRDVKPANVLLDEDGGAHLSDFGVGRLLTRNSATSSSELIGTADYMAPELLEHKPATPAADVYAAGCMFHEVLTGEPPFAGTSIAVILLAHLHRQPQRPDGLGDAVWTLVSRMLAKDPSERPTVDAAIAEIDRVFPAVAVDAPPAPPAPPTVRTVPPRHLDRQAPAPRQRSGHRRKILWTSAALFCLGLTVTGGLLFGPWLGTPGQVVAAPSTVAPATTDAPTASAATTPPPPARGGTEGAPEVSTTAPSDVTTDVPPPSDTPPDEPDGPDGSDGPDGPDQPPVCLLGALCEPPCPGDSPDCSEPCAGHVTCPPTCPPDCTPPCPAAPEAPTDVGWNSGPGGDIPSWTQPPTDGCHPVLSYTLTLHDLNGDILEFFVWSPGDVGVRALGCLGNRYPEVESFFRYDVTADNEAGTSAVVTSADVQGTRC